MCPMCVLAWNAHSRRREVLQSHLQCSCRCTVYRYVLSFQAEETSKMGNEILPQWLGYFEKIVSANSSAWSAGDTVRVMAVKS